MTCCGDVWIDVGGYVGLYKPMSNGTTKNEAPVYETSSGGFLWYNGMRGWNLGPDYNAYLWLTVISPDGTFCPEDALTWQDYENSAWVDDEDAEVRCSNCSIWPAYEECFTCCDSVTWTNPDGGSWTGQWDVYTTTPSNDNRIVYQKADSPTYCLYFSGYWWIINTCSNIGAWSGYLFSEQTQKTCVHGNPAMWTGKGYVVTCSSSCSSNPPAAPSGATSDWDGVAKIGGTIVTYSCANSETTFQAICDPASSTWLPTSIDQYLCNSKPPPTLAPSPAPAPAPVTPPPSTDCIVKDKKPYLEKLTTIKKVKSAKLCHEMCVSDSSCTYFSWRKKYPRSCQLYTVGYTTKENFYAGPAFCDENTEHLSTRIMEYLPFSLCIRKNKKLNLKELERIRKVRTAELCQEECVSNPSCTYFAWKKGEKVAKSVCFLYTVDYKNKSGFSVGPAFCMENPEYLS